MLARSLTYQQIMEAIAFNREPIRSWRKYKLWVVEDYRAYPWAIVGFDAVLPARLLGALEVAALQGGIKVIYQTAGLIKQFANNEKLQLLGWLPYLKNKHERDAARHAAYFILCRKVRERDT